MQNLAIFGGSFNPVHNGHLTLAKNFTNRLQADKTLIIPSNTPPHKSADELASAAARLEMCRLAVSGLPGFEVSDIEINRQGRSYTVDTLRQLRGIYPCSRLFLIVGADMLLTLHLWKDYRDILDMAVVCAAPRNRQLADQLFEYAKTRLPKTAQVIIESFPPVIVSSTEIRERIKKDLDVSHMLPTKVQEYIECSGLYK